MVGVCSIGILALQGGVREHEAALRKLGCDTVQVRKPRQLENLSALVLPGGESTTLI
ncbi:MAG: pyridoxal 5'-phosphate synthase glutaminase subunit PdxT, partial [Candidatus Aegiribacteria sp.]|nr:pyridoxal 5'-phosphate synthase glutaminase subunit PdxT [Candidatus Aegiribacteria sp.]MBD3294487.1 pyridoxal 5'-phosphate synthase glutaminase subunit PdxT [Candidatus Fermentibacteria bacterium]